MNIKPSDSLVIGTSPGTHKKTNAPGFWRQLALAVEPLGGSHAESLESRVSRLEAEVARWSSGGPNPR